MIHKHNKICMENNTETEELLEMVKRTFTEIIPMFVINSEADKDVNTAYTRSMNQQFVSVYSLALELGTELGTKAEYNDEGNYVNFDNEVEKDKYLETYVKELEEELNGKLGDMPIRILCPNIPFLGDEW